MTTPNTAANGGQSAILKLTEAISKMSAAACLNDTLLGKFVYSTCNETIELINAIEADLRATLAAVPASEPAPVRDLLLEMGDGVAGAHLRTFGKCINRERWEHIADSVLAARVPVFAAAPTPMVPSSMREPEAATLPAAPAPTDSLISILEEISVIDLAYKQRDLATKALDILAAPAPTEQASQIQKGHPIYELLMLGVGTIAAFNMDAGKKYAADVRAALAARPAPTEAPVSIDTPEFREKLCSVFAVKTLLYSGALPALIAHINDWAARQAPDSRDADRLDWLIKEECMVENLALGDTRYRIRWPNLEEAQTDWFKNARDAIDAAGAKEKAQ